MTLQENEINKKGYRRRFRSTVKFSAKTIRQVTTKPNSQEVLFLTIGNKMHNCRGMTGMLLPKVEWQEEINLCLSSYLTTINHKNEVDMLALNLTPNIVIVAENQEIANFKVLSRDEAESFIPIPPEMIILGKAKGVSNQINQLLQFQEKIEPRQLKKPKPNHNSLWFPTPETWDNPEQLTAIPRNLYEEIYNFQQLDRKRPKVQGTWQKRVFSKVWLEQFNIGSRSEKRFWEFCSRIWRYFCTP